MIFLNSTYKKFSVAQKKEEDFIETNPFYQMYFLRLEEAFKTDFLLLSINWEALLQTFSKCKLG